MATIMTLASSVPVFRPYRFLGGSLASKLKNNNLSIKSPATSSLKVKAKFNKGEVLASADDTSSKFNEDNWLASADELSGSFPPGFLFGGSSSSYQYEGAFDADGKSPSIWDTFTLQNPDKIADGSNGDVAINFCHRYKDDVKLMKQVGMNAFRLSISWPRILPGIQPFVTLFHWDVPQVLEDEYGGFLSSQIVSDFRDYAEVCFKEFGDRVKFWITHNEPWTFAYIGYDLGAMAPGRCSAWKDNGCPAGNSGTEPYVVGHNLLLSHAAAVQLYREKYQASQKGQIEIVLVSHWMVPYSDATYDDKAAQRAIDFMFGWFMHPLTYGDYPESMRTLVGERLPQFTEVQAMMLKKSIDFLGLNYYTSEYAANVEFPNPVDICYSTDSRAKLTLERNGIPIGGPSGSSGFCVCPQGLQDLLVYTMEKYNNPPIYILLMYQNKRTLFSLGDASSRAFSIHLPVQGLS